jgi:hypothetical protein
VKFIAQAIGLLGFLSLLGSIATFIVMENSRIGNRSVRPSMNPFGNYKPEYFNAQGRSAQAWCMRFFVGFTLSFLAVVGIALVLAP